MNPAYLALAVLAAALCLAQAPTARADSVKSTSQNSHVGYDLHTDIFYLDDKLVDEAYKRKNFNNNPRITLAGQSEDMIGRPVAPAVNPFAVAQKSVVSFGSSLDRFDVKENEHGHQFFGLYQGHKSPFVVNALRASLLKNMIQDLSTDLAALDAEASKSPEVADETTQAVELKIVETVRKQDQLILQYQKDSDSSSANALVVIVTKSFVVTVNVGQNKAVAINPLGVETISGATIDSRDVFGAKKNKKNGYLSKIMVDIQPRSKQDDSDDDDDGDYETQFVIMETGSVANYISNDEVYKIVLKEVKSLGKDSSREQDMYSKCVNGITTTVASKINLFKKVGSSDHTVILIGLTRDYRNIH